MRSLVEILSERCGLVYPLPLTGIRRDDPAIVF
jgi:hypothetical protein